MKKSDPTKVRGYKVNPLGTVFDNGYYYLFCFDDFFGKISHYRIDRMDGVRMLEEDITDGVEVNDFDLSTRKRQLFSMFGGETITVEIEADKCLIDVIHDKFGNMALLHEKNDTLVCFSAEVQVSPTFLAWCCSFGNRILFRATAYNFKLSNFLPFKRFFYGSIMGQRPYLKVRRLTFLAVLVCRILKFQAVYRFLLKKNRDK